MYIINTGVHCAWQVALRAKGWELRRQDGDGNCLFRAISQQIYGDPGMHGDIRRQCLEFMRKVGADCWGYDMV